MQQSDANRTIKRHVVVLVRFSPLAPGGEGPGGEGEESLPTQNVPGSGSELPPHPQPLSPKGRGREF